MLQPARWFRRNYLTIQEVLSEQERAYTLLDNIVLLARLEDNEEKILQECLQELNELQNQFTIQELTKIFAQFNEIDSKFKFIDSIHKYAMPDAQLMENILNLKQSDLLLNGKEFTKYVNDFQEKYEIIYLAREYTQNVINDVNYKFEDHVVDIDNKFLDE